MFHVGENTNILRVKSGIQLFVGASANAKALDLLKLPFNSYFIDQESRLVMANEHVAHNHNLGSLNDIVGRDISYYIPDKTEAVRIMANDKNVRDNQSLQFLQEKYRIEEGVTTSYLSLKMPVFDEKNNTIGLFGCSQLLEVDLQKAIAFLNTLMQVGIINPYQNLLLSKAFQSNTLLSKENFQSRFTAREWQVIQLVRESYTAKKIARVLKISHRTVECHLENAKSKMKVKSKRELLEKLFTSNT